MKRTQLHALIITLLILLGIAYLAFGESIRPVVKSTPKKEVIATPKVTEPSIKAGKVIDVYNEVNVYYNGRVGNVSGRNLTKDGYNLGLKYQCVEFVKRFYYEYFDHKMPDSYGHARDFFDPNVADGSFSQRRGLYQHINGGKTKPKVNDIIVFGPTEFNEFGHIAIISEVNSGSIEIVQQNPGQAASSRMDLPLKSKGDIWYIDDIYTRCWLRK